MGGRGLNVPTAPGGDAQLHLLGGWALMLDGNQSCGNKAGARPGLDQSRDAGRVRVELPADPRRLFALLALHGRMPRTLVAGMLWPHETDDVAASRLRAQLGRLRDSGRGVASLLEVSGASLAVHQVVAVDVDRFKAAARQLVRGMEESDAVGIVLDDAELLPGWCDDWVLAAREQVWYLRLSALCSLAATRHTQHRHQEALQAAMAAIGTEPLHEARTVSSPAPTLTKATLSKQLTTTSGSGLCWLFLPEVGVGEAAADEQHA